MHQLSESICVVGLGYIGLPTASLLATKGYQVLGVDVNDVCVKTINRGDIHIHEPDLDVLVKSAVQSGRLSASARPTSADIFIIAVPTPINEDHTPNLDFVEAATRSIAPFIQPGNLVILESTSPVGTTERIADWLRQERADLIIPHRNVETSDDQIFITHCPERILPGRMLIELVENDRIIGGIDRASADRACAFYRTFVNGRIVPTDSRTAELCKLSENTFRDVNIAFANELSMICDRLDINVWELIELANHHPRVNILKPGPGVGGHCIAVDPWFVHHAAPDVAPLTATARHVNDAKPQHIIRKIKEALKQSRSDQPVLACLGLAFKANVDDLRESPAVQIVRQLATQGVTDTRIVEPFITDLPETLQIQGLTLTDLDSAIADADVVALLVDHDVFRSMNLERLNGKQIIDTRGVWQRVGTQHADRKS